MLNEIGPTAMTMDMVARSCGISKRTLYETFPDKKTLVMECIAADHMQHQEEATRIFNEAENCFEGLFKVFQTTRRHNTRQAQMVIDEIVRLYPEVKESKRNHEHKFIEGMSAVVAQAQEQGLVLDSVKAGIAGLLFVTLMKSLHKSNEIEAMGYDKGQVFDAAFVNFLRGLATIKGQEIIERSIKKYIE